MVGERVLYFYSTTTRSSWIASTIQLALFFRFSFLLIFFLFFGNSSGVFKGKMGFWLPWEINTRGIERFRTKMMNSLYGCIYTLIDWVVLKYHLNNAILERVSSFNRAYRMTTFEYPRTNQRLNRVFFYIFSHMWGYLASFNIFSA